MTTAPVIHCIGDSHAGFFTGRNSIYPDNSVARPLPFFKVFHLGPVLAYNLPESGTTTGGREKLFSLLEEEVPAGSWVMPVFGEIDCRAHLLRQAEKQERPVADLAAECAERYFGVVQEIQAKGFSIVVYNSIPSLPEKSTWAEGKEDDFPTYGSQADRNAAIQAFNQNLGELCAANGIPFLSTYDCFVDESGRPKREFYMDKIHLGQSAMLQTLERLQVVLPNFDFSPPERYVAEQAALDGASQKSSVMVDLPGYIRRKALNWAEALHPRSLAAIVRGASKAELKAIRHSLRPQPAHPDRKRQILREHGERFNCKVFIETGTYLGDTLDALADDFDALHSIELSPQLYQDAKRRFSEKPFITMHQGNSGDVLPHLLEELNEPALFWLDGHASGSDTAQPDELTPILRELKAVVQHPIKQHCIMIDDAREFGRGKGYPSLKRVRAIVDGIYPGWEVAEDIIRITP
ncbi:MAG: SGNH/GDSL hydrolase family protein [Verrucomicrobiota bacterium]